uniref:Nematode Specific Peptide family, group C n=2 Tax=Caenorhabditis tropicalis TaxID=1561998 RepID=A0A1I7UTQ1_9PELO
MMFRTVLSLCFISLAAAVTMEICQEYCASVNGGASYDNCSPWYSYATHHNKTCYNLCVHNCAAVYDGSCMTGNNFRCCLPTTPAKTQQFKTSGCNKIYNALPGWNSK